MNIVNVYEIFFVKELDCGLRTGNNYRINKTFSLFGEFCSNTCIKTRSVRVQSIILFRSISAASIGSWYPCYEFPISMTVIEMN